MWPSDLAPDYPDVRAANLTLRPVNESNLLAQVEAATVLADPFRIQTDVWRYSLRRVSVVDTLDLDQAMSCQISFRRLFPV